ncbi:amylo-alpha-1,6-glucosidase [Thermodesulfatator indicus]
MKKCITEPKLQQFYILATSPGLAKEALILKHGDSFALFDPHGDIRQEGLGEQGLYHCGTRFLSKLELHFCQARPFWLNSATTQDNLMVVSDLTNPDMLLEEEEFLPRGSVHILRQKFLYKGTCYEAVKIENFSPCKIHLPLSIAYDADFVDIFEVRGFKRKKKGKFFPVQVDTASVTFKYLGLDGKLRITKIIFDPPPAELNTNEAVFHLELNPKEKTNIFVVIACFLDQEEEPVPFVRAYLSNRQELKRLRRTSCQVSSPQEFFDAWLKRSESDLFMMLTETPYGLYPYAGIPWFNTYFGRDAIITALESLWLNPEIAKGVLRFLAATQATEFDPARDAEPGKILHEMRFGELAATGEIPFARYYGTVDATPLFLVLAGAYYERTQDINLIKDLWPHFEAALLWMKEYGDLDGDGFIEYQASEEGLVNKGWKDSHDSVFHADGTMASPPIALVEVQAYAYLAYLKMARLAKALGQTSLAEQLKQEAQILREKFLKAFWDEDMGFFVLALDGDKRPCRVYTSNAGHVLWGGLAEEKQAISVAKRLFSENMFSGWGVRTLSAKEILFNPVSYHNGSVWPHDNAIIARGLARYRLKHFVAKILTGLAHASEHFPLHRMPELFCGFKRRPDQGPIPYPVACNPQAWAAGAVFMLIEAVLGLEFIPSGLCFCYPVLPPFLRRLKLRNLRVNGTSIDLDIVNHDADVTINVLRKPKGIEILVRK